MDSSSPARLTRKPRRYLALFQVFLFYEEIHVISHIFSLKKCKDAGKNHFQEGQSKKNDCGLELFIKTNMTQCQDEFRSLSGCVPEILTACSMLQISIAWCQIQHCLATFNFWVLPDRILTSS